MFVDNVGFNNFLSHETNAVFDNDIGFDDYMRELNSLEKTLDFGSTQSMWD